MNINDMTKEEQIKVVSSNPFVIQYIKNPSEAVQLIAVKQNVWLIIHIMNPTKEVLIFSLLKLLQDNWVVYVTNLLQNIYADRNYPELIAIRNYIANYLR